MYGRPAPRIASLAGMTGAVGKSRLSDSNSKLYEAAELKDDSECTHITQGVLPCLYHFPWPSVFSSAQYHWLAYRALFLRICVASTQEPYNVGSGGG